MTRTLPAPPAPCRASVPSVRVPPRGGARARGSVRNDSAGVLIDVEGEPARIAELTRV
jgi:hypothetical protein